MVVSTSASAAASAAAAREAADALGVRYAFAVAKAAQFWKEVEAVSRLTGRQHAAGAAAAAATAGGSGGAAAAAMAALVAQQLPRAMDIHRATLTDAVNHSSAVAAALAVAGSRMQT